MRRGLCLILSLALPLTGCPEPQPVVVNSPKPTKTEVKVPAPVVLKRHRRDVSGVAFTPDGKSLVSSGGSYNWGRSGDRDIGEVFVWDVPSGKYCGELFGHQTRATCVAISPDGAEAVTGSMDSRDGIAKRWNIGKRKFLADFDDRPSFSAQAVLYSPDGSKLIVCGGKGADEGDIRIWNLKEGGDPVRLPGPPNFAQCAAISADGTTLAVGGGGEAEGELRLFEVGTWKDRRPSLTTEGPVWSVSFSPDGKTLAYSFGLKKGYATVSLLDLETGRERLALPGKLKGYTVLAFAPDGDSLAVGSEDGLVRLFAASDGKELLALTGHSQLVSSFAFTRDGAKLASSSSDGTIRIWDVSAYSKPPKNRVTK